MSQVGKAPRRYVAELGGAGALYAASLVIRAHFAASVGDPVLRDLLLASPILPVLLGGLAVVNLIRHTDEYVRHLILKSLAVAAGATILFCFSWAFLRDVGLPDLPIEDAGMVTMAVWVVAAISFKWHDNPEMLLKTLKRLGLSLLVGAICAALYALIARLAGADISPDIAIIVGSVAFIIGAILTIAAQKKQC